MTSFTLAFDIYGTLIDTTSIEHSVNKIIGDSSKLFTQTWRNTQLEYSFRRGLMNSYVDFSICTKQALDYTCKKLNEPLTSQQKNNLLNEYKTLPIYPDVIQGLKLLQNTNHKIYAFSNGSNQAIQNLIKTTQIDQFINGSVSAEDVKIFKPSPIVYRYFNTKTDSTKNMTWLISSNPFDIIGASAYGMRTIWVRRSSESVFDPWGIIPTKTIGSLIELKDVLDSSI